MVHVQVVCMKRCILQSPTVAVVNISEEEINKDSFNLKTSK